MRSTWFAAATLVAAISVSVLSAATVATPAYAADLGALSLSPQSGSIRANPAFAGVTTAVGCPTGYGTNATVKVGRSGAAVTTFGNLNAIQSDPAGYSAAAFTLATNRSLARGITGSDTGTVPAGGYDIIVICSGDVLGDNVNVFRTTITVTGETWVKSAGGGPPSSPSASAGGDIEVTATIGARTGSPSVSPTASASPSGPAGGGLPRTGVAVAGFVGLGLALTGAGAVALWLSRRQRVRRT